MDDKSRSDNKNDNFKVGLRVRPPLTKESNSKRCVHLEHGGVSVFRGNLGLDLRGRSPQALIDVTDLANLQPDPKPQTFFYDSLFDITALQEEVYDTCAQPIVLSVLEGYNGSVIAYGQTGTGKTHTIEGTYSEEGRGLIPRCSEEIFHFIQNKADSDSKFLVRVSFLEIYNERLFDLLDPSHEKLRVREDGSSCTFVEGLSEHVVKGTMDVNRLLRKGSTARITDGSKMNKESSRSHAVFTIVIERSGGSYRSRVTIGKLRLVDLAGSERFDIEAKDKHLTETKNINTSLTTFGKVVLALTSSGYHSYIPYRDSKLTRILQDSLGGNSKAFLVCTVSPMTDCYLETLSTLKFAQRAKHIQNKAIVNQDFTKKAMLSAYEKEIARLHKELIESREGWVSAGELERVKEEKERVELEREEVMHMLARQNEQSNLKEDERESLEKKIQELELLVLKGGDKSKGSLITPERELVDQRQALEAERKRLEDERIAFKQEKDSFLRARTAPDGQTGSDEENTDMTSPYRRRAGSISSSISSLRTGQNTPIMRQSRWSQNYASMYPAGPVIGRSHQGWVGYPQQRSSVTALLDASYRKSLITYVTALANPKTGIPCKQFDNGLSVFSGSHAVKWFMDNMDGVGSVNAAADVGQKLMNLQVFISMDGTLHFLPSDTNYYRFSPEYIPIHSSYPSRESIHSIDRPISSAVPSIRSNKSRSLSPESYPLSNMTSDNLSTNTYSLLSDTSSISSYSSMSSATRIPLIDRLGWSSASLLHMTASQGNRSLLKRLVATQNVNELDTENRSALMYACVGDQLKAAEILIKKGANTNLVDKAGNSALIYAVQFGRDQLVKLLLKSSADSSLKNKEGKNAIHICAEIEESLRCLEFLCKHSSVNRAVNERDGRMQSPLHISVFANLPQHTRMLLVARAKLCISDAEGRTPLHYAITANSLICLQIILEVVNNIITSNYILFESGFSIEFQSILITCMLPT
ncbi:Kinesin-like protein KIF3A [Oopsacas minuta]|uniref:Kinesin-like protein n=1 Tax=Oopsacas minuta TaxID=111878 RepID=A0AAV7K1X7_9METZ|nr:Kinesin-like protein KIF3A [Oopsacas minuta]